jgi:O-antigen/teichoic acid export membrane protein
VKKMPENVPENKNNSLLKSLSISTINQFVTSGSNFILGLFLIRILSVSEFGLYGILQASAFVLAGLGNVVFLGQMVVNFPDQKKSEQHNYVSSIFHLIIVLSLSVIFITAVIFIILEYFFNMGLTIWFELCAVIIFSIGYLSKEFFCRLSYTHRKEIRALRINIIISITMTMTIMIIVLALSHIVITAPLVILCYGICTFIGVLLGLFETRLQMKPDSNRMIKSLKQVWVAGRWALYSDVLYSGRQQAHVFITAIFAGTAGVGMINAAKLFLTPVMLLTPSLSQIYIVRLVALRQSEPLKLLKRGVTFSIANAISVILYSVFLLFIYDYIVAFIIPETFSTHDISEFVIAWSFVALFTAVRYGLESTQKAMKKFKLLAFINTPISLIALASVYILLMYFGPVGAIYGLALADFIFTVILASLVCSSAKQLRTSNLSRDEK